MILIIFLKSLNHSWGKRHNTKWGQRQRTALGRALLVDSPIVFDDALASVDNKTASRIIDKMRERSDKTILPIIRCCNL